MGPALPFTNYQNSYNRPKRSRRIQSETSLLLVEEDFRAALDDFSRAQMRFGK